MNTNLKCSFTINFYKDFTMSTPANQPTVQVSKVAIIELHDESLVTLNWPPKIESSKSRERSDVWRWIGENHRNNALLWDQEDLARRTTVSDSEITGNKRKIDSYNQARNDAIERTDEFLLIALGLVSNDSAQTTSPVTQAASGARLNSETAGSMVDRMSIVALKIKAMRWQLTRSDVDAQFLSASAAKLERLIEQRNDLGDCLDQLLADTKAGKAYFKVYRQFKMYNDASMNPALIAEKSATAKS